MFVPKELAISLEEEIQRFLNRRSPKGTTINHLFKPIVGVGDDILPERISFEETKIVRITFTPSEESIYWRFGFRFSHNGFPLMPPQRTAHGYPLWHLTRNDNAQLVGSTYYGVDQIEDTTEGLVVSPYRNTPLIIYAYKEVLEKESVIRIVIDDRREIKYVKNLPFADHQFAWISSWGDQFDYCLDAEIKIK